MLIKNKIAKIKFFFILSGVYSFSHSKTPIEKLIGYYIKY